MWIFVIVYVLLEGDIVVYKSKFVEFFVILINLMVDFVDGFGIIGRLFSW